MESLRALLKKQFTIGVRRSLRQLGSELRLQRLHRSAVRKARRLQPPLKLHLGCGDNIKPGWVNIDLFMPRACIRVMRRTRAALENSFNAVQHLTKALLLSKAVEPPLRIRFEMAIESASNGLHSTNAPRPTRKAIAKRGGFK